MRKVVGFRCVHCGAELASAKVEYICPRCGGNVQVVYDYKAIRRVLTRGRLEKNPDKSIWRYIDILPVKSSKFAPRVFVGNTPLYPSANLGKELGLKSLFIKDDGRNPSASFKDRAGAIVLAHALEKKEALITGASTGNAASSMACLASSLKMPTVIFVPAAAPAAKIAQLLVFGAKVITVEGSYDQAFDLCLQASAAYGWYNRNTGFNPYTREGKKTCAFEIIEQLGWKAPDKVFVSVGDGNIISGLWKGFRDFYALGLIDSLPRMIAVQANGSDAVKRAFENGGPLPTVTGATVADSISVSLPRDGEAAVQALRESKGFAVGVDDDEIIAAIPALARAEGVFAEPAGAATIAGLKRAVAEGLVKERERVVAVITGNGLKDIQSAMRSVGQPYRISPTLDALKGLVDSELSPFAD